MQFAVPPRRSPLPIARSSRTPPYRRKQLKTIAIFTFAILSLLYLLHHFFSSTSSSIAASAGTSGVVIVTLLDRKHLSESYVKKIIANREDYAKRHGKYTHHGTKTKLIPRHTNRLYKLLRQHNRLRRRSRRRPEKLVHSPSSTPRISNTPPRSIHLSPQPTLTNNEPEQIAQTSPRRERPAGLADVEGCTHRPAR